MVGTAQANTTADVSNRPTATPPKDSPLNLPVSKISLKSLIQKATKSFNENQIDEAASVAEQIVDSDPNNVLALRILGVSARMSLKFEQSLEYYYRAIKLKGESSALHFEKGVTYAEMKRQREAYECFLKSTQFNPPYQPAFVNISTFWSSRNDTKNRSNGRGKQSSSRAIALWHAPNLANSLRECGRVADAISHYELAVKYRPDYAKAKWNLGICHVLLGHFAQAWPLFELHNVAEEVKLDKYPQPRWDGSPLAGKTIVVHAEQGIGDEVLFASCFDDVIRQAGKTILVCEPRLQKLFARSFPRHRLRFGRGEKTGGPCRWRSWSTFKFPRQPATLFSQSCGRFSSARSIPDGRSRMLETWRQRLSQHGGLKIGISWRAGGKANEGRKRTIELLDWRDILSVANVTFINLQYGDTVDDLAQVQQELGGEFSTGNRAIPWWIWTATPPKSRRWTW